MATLSRRNALGGLAGIVAAVQSKALAQAPADVVPGSITYEDIPYPHPVKTLPLTLYGQDVRMAYMDVPPAGAANGRQIVLLHGMNFGGFYFGGLIESLRKEGFRPLSAGPVEETRSRSRERGDPHSDVAAFSHSIHPTTGEAGSGQAMDRP